MTTALTRAFADSERSYFAAKQSVSNATEQMLARGPRGAALGQRADLSRASEQLRHFKGWVYASIRPIAQRIAGQPIHVGRARRPGRLGTKQVDADALDSHPILDLLADPNDLMVSWSLMFTTVASLELTGRSLWWLPGMRQILPIPTSWIVGFEGSTRFTAFRVRPPNSGQAFDIPADECCYFAYPDPADPHGAVSPLQASGGAVDADESMTASQAAMFRRGIHPSHAVIVGREASADGKTMRPRLTDAQQRQIIGAIRKRYADVHNHGEPVILDGLIEDVKRLSNTPAEMDWLDSGKTTKARIMQGFGVNPIIAGEVEGANRASSHAAEDHFCQFTINPKITLLSQCMTEYLSPMFGGGLVVWIEECRPRDAEMNLRWAETLAKHGVLTAHELRALSPFDLDKESSFDGVLVGGKNLTTWNPIEAGIAEIVRGELGGAGADRVLELSGANHRGNGRFAG
jgi:phage portal protein BeeE